MKRSMKRGLVTPEPVSDSYFLIFPIFFLDFFFLHLVNVFLGGNVIEWTDTLQGLSAHKISERGDWNVGPDPEDRSRALICSKEERVV